MRKGISASLVESSLCNLPRACRRSSGGGITFAADVPQPTPAAGQLLIRVMAAGINPADYKIPKVVGGKCVGWTLQE